MIKKIICIIMSFMLLGCSMRPETLTPKEFKMKMEQFGVEVIDATEQIDGDIDYQNIYIGIDEKRYSFEYYFMRNEQTALNVFEYLSDGVESNYNSKGEIKNKKNSKYFIMEQADYYIVLVLRENSVLYVTSYPEYKDEVNDILGELNY